MKYRKPEAREFARAHLRGIWAATPTPFLPDLSLDAGGFAKNLRHWIDELLVDGFFVGGKQGEFFSMSIAERKSLAETAVRECNSAPRNAGVMISCSDQNLETVLDLAHHAVSVGADYVVVHSPVLHFATDVDTLVYEYYRYLAEALPIGLVMWSHPDAGYIMSPELCARIAHELPSVVAIKYSAPRDHYIRLTRIAGHELIVSSASEAEWFDNLIELDWQVYLCSIPPLLYQTAIDRRIHDYSALAWAGKIDEARRVRDSLDPVRDALRLSRPHGTPHAQQKYWLELLGQVGGPVRRPLMNLTADERERIRAAFNGCGLRLPAGIAPP
ncbi:MAG: dihydrodipicolinate synthase family protein [Steroidobacterales bacterium]